MDVAQVETLRRSFGKIRLIVWDPNSFRPWTGMDWDERQCRVQLLLSQKEAHKHLEVL